jgi:hypothetical protein
MHGGALIMLRHYVRFNFSKIPVIASEAKQSILSLCGEMDCFASLAMTAPGYDFAIPPRTAPGICKGSPSKEGAGNAGCALHPRSRVQNCAKETHTSIQVQRKHSGIPRAMALPLMPRSPRRRIRLVTVTAGWMADPIRLDRISHRQLDTSNGCQDHAVLPYASAPFVCAL